MTIRMRWMGVIALLVVTMAVPLPALARVVHNENGNGVVDPGERPGGALGFYTIFGDGGVNVDIVLGSKADPTWTANSICVASDTPAATLPGGPPVPPYTLGYFANSQGPTFDLRYPVGNSFLAPSIIKVGFKVRFSTNELVSPPTPPTFLLRQLDHFLARLSTAAGSYNILLVDPSGPQASKTALVTTTVAGWSGTWGTGDTVPSTGAAYTNGTGTLTVLATIYPNGADQTAIRANGQARLLFGINTEGVVFLNPSVACVQNIVVDVTP